MSLWEFGGWDHPQSLGVPGGYCVLAERFRLGLRWKVLGALPRLPRARDLPGSPGWGLCPAGGHAGGLALSGCSRDALGCPGAAGRGVPPGAPVFTAARGN